MIKGSSDNLPIISYQMVVDFIQNNSDFSAAETRHEKLEK